MLRARQVTLDQLVLLEQLDHQEVKDLLEVQELLEHLVILALRVFRVQQEQLVHQAM